MRSLSPGLAVRRYQQEQQACALKSRPATGSLLGRHGHRWTRQPCGSCGTSRALHWRRCAGDAGASACFIRSRAARVSCGQVRAPQSHQQPRIGLQPWRRQCPHGERRRRQCPGTCSSPRPRSSAALLSSLDALALWSCSSGRFGAAAAAAVRDGGIEIGIAGSTWRSGVREKRRALFLPFSGGFLSYKS